MSTHVWASNSNAKEIPPFPVSAFPRTRNAITRSIVRAARTRSIVRRKFVRRINTNVTTINAFQVFGFATETTIVVTIQVSMRTAVNLIKLSYKTFRRLAQ
jgi:hypothetical protein